VVSYEHASEPDVSLILYGTDACHLCELAEKMLQLRAAGSASVAYKKTDISLSDPLFERYGIRIPVLRHASGKELDWPFTEAQLDAFLQD
jgi:hypothetical protein